MGKPPKLNYSIRASSGRTDTAVNAAMFSLALAAFGTLATLWSVWQGAALSALGIAIGIFALFKSPRLALAWVVTGLNLTAAAFAFLMYRLNN